jgi:hypothetical protein
MGGRTLARCAVVVALIGAAVGVATATPALATPPPEDPGPTICPTVARNASATWMMPDGVTSAGVYVSDGTTLVVRDPRGMCQLTPPLWVRVNWRTALSYCDSQPTPVPAGGFAMDPTLSTARLDVSTSCGDAHVTWTSPSPPSVQPEVFPPCTFATSCVEAGVWLERASHAEGTIGPITGTQQTEWPPSPPQLGVQVHT